MFCLFYKVVQTQTAGMPYATKDENTLFPISRRLLIFFVVGNDSNRPLCPLSSYQQNSYSMCCSFGFAIAQVETNGKAVMAMTNPKCRKVNSNTIVKSDIYCYPHVIVIY